ncbi:hypothetical protein D305_gp52 [Pseudomonas phage UFV-P2]|uniref:Uncharacterized protein n=1 Tax=Pseudomonas phage UFV-P2 TaxID=1235661 RepID=M4T4M1_9CAUD|nr:hypothetical protein D305_gp52 [Pseudomonas phage UFV-P2]AGH62729.1 hypothetical protein [Pseudomonas phage UFV-P2]
MKGFWKVKVDKHSGGPFTMWATPWLYLIKRRGKFKVELGAF